MLIAKIVFFSKIVKSVQSVLALAPEELVAEGGGEVGVGASENADTEVGHSDGDGGAGIHDERASVKADAVMFSP